MSTSWRSSPPVTISLSASPRTSGLVLSSTLVSRDTNITVTQNSHANTITANANEEGDMSDVDFESDEEMEDEDDKKDDPPNKKRKA